MNSSIGWTCWHPMLLVQCHVNPHPLFRIHSAQPSFVNVQTLTCESNILSLKLKIWLSRKEFYRQCKVQYPHLDCFDFVSLYWDRPPQVDWSAGNSCPKSANYHYWNLSYSDFMVRLLFLNQSSDLLNWEFARTFLRNFCSQATFAAINQNNEAYLHTDLIVWKSRVWLASTSV